MEYFKNKKEELITITDSELIVKYRKYIRKRNTIIILIVFFILGSIIVGFSLTNKKPPVIKDEPKIEVDITPPELLLTEKEITIIQGEAINYTSYIICAISSDGEDLINNVIYNEIDINSTGKQEIIYEVSDNNGNISRVALIVNINEKEVPPVEVIPPDNSKKTPKENNNSNNNNNNSSSNNNTGSKEQPKELKYFLFSDGYTMSNVADECAKVLRTSGKAGICVPLKNASGIYIGMRLDYY